jgi:hypothetical protein
MDGAIVRRAAAVQQPGEQITWSWIGRIAMSVSFPRFAVLTLAALLGLVVAETFAQQRSGTPASNAGNSQAPAIARPQIRPWYATNFTPENVAAAQFARNASMVGAGLSAIPPYALGYNPYPSAISTGPVVAPLAPYALTTTPSYNPYATSGSLSTTPGGYGGYSMSTVPYGSWGAPYYNYGNQDPYGSYLQGLASVTSATGQYYQQITQARITREQARQMAIDTHRKQIEFEMWYETVRPTAPKLIAQQAATNLDEARNYASATKIWSGDALNQLFNSILRTGKLNRGPSIALEEDTLHHINLTAAAGGNAGLLKNGASLQWPLVLTDQRFGETPTKLGLKLKDAVAQLKELKKVEPTTLRDADALFKELTDKLNDSADDLTAQQFIEARRYLNQVGQAIRALKDPKAANYFNRTWNARGKTVAELVDFMDKEGLVFAPATSGDEAAYRALYNGLRSFEAGLQGAQNR